MSANPATTPAASSTPVPPIARLSNTIQPYAWGSRTLMADLLGRPSPSPEPMAELWMGAHPKAPSRVELPGGGTASLADLIAANPIPWLGERVATRFANQLPFLFKVLAADQALSIQAHPTLAQAREGFARENAAGLAADAPGRNYRDANHKPEVLCALTPFWAMKGFRPIEEIADHFTHLATAGVPVTPPSDAADVKQQLAELLSLSPGDQAIIAEAALDLSRRLGDDDLAWDWVGRLFATYPGDIGVLSPLFLNVLQLQPGEAIYTDAGDLHAYLGGMGIELMANSDNVLRGGLTPKHIDVKELMHVLTVTPGLPSTVDTRDSAGLTRFPTPAPEFELSLLQRTGGTGVDGTAGGAPWCSPVSDTLRLVICTAGELRLSAMPDTSHATLLRPGDSAVIPATTSQFAVAGIGTLYIAATP